MVAPQRVTSMGTAQPALRRRLEQHLDELPVLPTVIAELMQLREDSPRYFEDVRKLIDREPTFTTRLLAAANSAASAPRKPIASVRDALSWVGSKRAANVLLAAAVTRVFVPRDPWEKGLWRHSLEVAILSRALARHRGLDPELAYTCGLLHDIGRFLLFQEAADQLRQIEQTPWRSADELLTAERRICGATHAELGAQACRKWRLPEQIAEMVANHHVPSRAEDAVTPIVACADMTMFASMRAAPGGPIEPCRETADVGLDAVVEAARAEAEATVRALGVS